MATRNSIRDKVSIVGVGCCPFGENWDQSPADMIVDAAYEAYADAGIEKPQEEIDAVFTGSIYSNKGPHECADALKLFNKPVTFATNYCATGTDLIRLG
jgi:acetyl-CoA C-acetyltransferase